MNAKIKQCLQPPVQGCCASSAILFLRLVAGLAFIFHGWGKIQSPFNWMGPDAAVPGFLQLLAAVSEFGGGIAWMLGLLTFPASLGIGCTMIVATSLHAFVLKDPFVSTGGGAFELPLVYLGIAIVFSAIGPGKYSADAKIFGERSN